jgi:hypothetical protein
MEAAESKQLLLLDGFGTLAAASKLGLSKLSRGEGGGCGQLGIGKCVKFCDKPQRVSTVGMRKQGGGGGRQASANKGGGASHRSAEEG